MPSAWLLPEHIADVLPAEARHIEQLRAGLLDAARGYGYELVIPPLLEHIDSLLSGAGKELGLQTFKLVDQLSGRTLGLRADTTSQAARIDAHLLNRRGLVRLCYCGPVLHTRPAGLLASREPLQFGAEIYGHAGLESDLEVLELALDCLRLAGLAEVTIDLADARIAHALLEDAPRELEEVVLAGLATKDGSTLRMAVTDLPEPARSGLLALLDLYGQGDILGRAARVLPDSPPIRAALADLRVLGRHAEQADSGVHVGFDLADVGRYTYYSGARFAGYVAGSSDAVVRGGRYDEVGAVFGRKRPAVGFSLDVKELALLLPLQAARSAIRAPYRDSPSLRKTIRQLRESGETVACLLPGHQGDDGGEPVCDRELVDDDDGVWRVRPLRHASALHFDAS